MYKKILLLVLISTFVAQAQQKKSAFKKGEFLKYRISYSNWFNAGSATLEIKESTNNGKAAYHIVGKGKTTGVTGWFFKVNDNYQTYFYKNNLLPYRFIRKINEGGYTKDKEIHFHQNSNKATVKDHEKNTEAQYTTHNNVHDMLSTLYYLRNYDISKMKKGDEVTLSMFFDEKNYPFKLRFLGTENIKTKFGKVATAKFRPLVQAGRVFKAKESITMWVSNDKNKIPLRIKADLAVGSIRADLDLYKGLANPFPIIFD